jgi:acetyl-CoA synthetase
MNDWLKLAKKYKIPSKKFNLVDIIEKRSKENPESIALTFQNDLGKVTEFTYKELVEKVNQYSTLLKNCGLRRKQRVALFLPKCPEIYFGMLATIKLGAIAMPLFEAFQQDGLELRLKKGDVNFLITNKDLFSRYDKIIKPKTLRQVFVVDSKEFKNLINESCKLCKTVKMNKNDPCLMIFTSSTAGTPVAGIMLPQGGTVQWMYTAGRILGLKKGTKYFCSAHPAWVTGTIYGVIAPLLLGVNNYSIQGRFDSLVWKDFLIKNKISHVYTAPTVLKLLRENVSKKDFKFIEKICSVGEALPFSLIEYYNNFEIKIIDTYWQTEIGAIIIANIPFRKKALGKSIGVEILLKNGEIVIKKPWPAMMVGIWKHKKMFESYFDGEMFLARDLAKKDKQDYFYFEGRKDDIIKISGERISPLEIESFLLKFPGIKECAIVGIPDRDRGNILKAYVVLDKKIKSDEKLKDKISNFVKKKYAGHAYPKIITFVENLPKGNSGKIIRSKLK